jgi:hypothetical protein
MDAVQTNTGPLTPGRAAGQKPRRPEILWGRLAAVVAFVIGVVLLLSFAVPVAYGVGQSVSNAIQHHMACWGHTSAGLN